jgi:hypothetical protein
MRKEIDEVGEMMREDRDEGEREEEREREREREIVGKTKFWTE